VLPLNVLGHLLGGMFLGLLAALLGLAISLLLSRETAMAAVGAIVLVYALADLLGVRLWRPNSKWQVPQGFRRTPYVGTMSLLWGLALGAGWATMNVTSAFFATFLAMAVVEPWLAFAGGMLFGVAQALTVLLALGGGDFDVVLERFSAVLRQVRVAAVVSAAVGVALAASLITTSMQ